jgi:hypothetical protein
MVFYLPLTNLVTKAYIKVAAISENKLSSKKNVHVSTCMCLGVSLIKWRVT